MRKNSQSGFTMVELSMVMLIFALLTAGIYTGKTLVDAANVRGVIKKLEKFEVGRAAFKQKFHCTPGDCPHASDYGLGVNGNGDGFITDQRPTGGLPRKELLEYWVHLDNAGLLAEDYSKIPSGSSLQNGAPETGLNGAHFSITYNKTSKKQLYLIGVDADATPAYRTISKRFPPGQMESIDHKIDDGYPLLGDMKSYYGITITSTGDLQYELPSGGFMMGSSGGSVAENCSLNNYDYNIGTEDPACVSWVSFRETMQ